METLIAWSIIIFIVYKALPAIFSLIFDVIGSAVKGMAVIFVMAVLTIAILKTMIGA